MVLIVYSRLRFMFTVLGIWFFLLFVTGVAAIETQLGLFVTAVAGIRFRLLADFANGTPTDLRPFTTYFARTSLLFLTAFVTRLHQFISDIAWTWLGLFTAAIVWTRLGLFMTTVGKRV